MEFYEELVAELNKLGKGTFVVYPDPVPEHFKIVHVPTEVSIAVRASSYRHPNHWRFYVFPPRDERGYTTNFRDWGFSDVPTDAKIARKKPTALIAKELDRRLLSAAIFYGHKIGSLLQERKDKYVTMKRSFAEACAVLEMEYKETNDYTMRVNDWKGEHGLMLKGSSADSFEVCIGLLSLEELKQIAEVIMRIVRKE